VASLVTLVFRAALVVPVSLEAPADRVFQEAPVRVGLEGQVDPGYRAVLAQGVVQPALSVVDPVQE